MHQQAKHHHMAYPLNAWNTSTLGSQTVYKWQMRHAPLTPPALHFMHLALTAIEHECINVILKWCFSRHCHSPLRSMDPRLFPFYI